MTVMPPFLLSQSQDDLSTKREQAYGSIQKTLGSEERFKATYFGHLVFSVAPGAEENHRQGGRDAPWGEKDILGRVCLFYVLEDIEGKHGVCHGKLFHCFSLE